jgi:excisionase family DNA binding protein
MSLEVIISNLTSDECSRIFHSFRWPEGVRCLKCNEYQKKIYTSKSAKGKFLRYHCEKCHIWFNDFTGTVFEGTRLSLNLWFKAIFYFLELHLTAIETAQRLNINRNTAQLINKKIQQNKLWCQLLINNISSKTNRNIEYLMTLKETQDYLGVSRQTIYRLIARGALSAIKVGGQWRFSPAELQKYLTTKLSRYGFIAVGEFYYFREAVLDKYRKEPTKYYLQDEAYQGWVGNKQDYNDVQTLGKKNLPAGAKVFSNLRYRKVVIAQGQPALAIRHKDYQELPREEYNHWSNHIIWQKH